MKKLTLTFLICLFTVLLSAPSYAKWTKVGENVNGTTFYMDFERIRKVDGYVYWWDLSDYLKPTKYGDLSAKSYHQGDCKLFRSRDLSFSFHKEPMGGGIGRVREPKGEQKNWVYPSPNSVDEGVLKLVCNHVKYSKPSD